MPGGMSPARTAQPHEHLWRWQVAAQVAVAMPELGWSVSEALLMPLLLELKVPSALLAVCWLVSPTAGLFLHPLLGELSDRHGRRPFVLVLGLMATTGLAGLPMVTRVLSGWPAIVAVTLAYGMTDMSHDLLLTPTRAAMNDVFGPEESQRRCALGGGAGKFIALLCVVVFGRGSAFFVCSGLMFTATAFQVLAPGASPGHCSALEHRARAVSIVTPHEDLDTPMEASRSHCYVDIRPVLSLRHPAGIVADKSNAFPEGFLTIWLLSFAGWLALMVHSFYLTAAWAEHDRAVAGTAAFDRAVKVASLLLMAGTFTFIAAGGALPSIVSLFRDEAILLSVCLLSFTGALLAFAPSCPDSVLAFFIVFVVPVGYQVVANVSFSWLESQPGFSVERRGTLTGWLNASLALAQGVTSVLSGPIVALSGGRLFGAMFAAAALSFAFGVAGLVAVPRLKLHAPKEPGLKATLL